jgi:hypothetical protein
LQFYKTLVLFSISGFLLTGFPTLLHAYKKNSSHSSLYSLNGKVDSRQLRAFEEQLTPFLQMNARSHEPSANFKNVYSPSQTDLFFIAKNWRRLSATFQSLYKRSAQIPAYMKYYASPGGHFEIYYATAGMDSINKLDTVDATDAYGFGPSNWRQRTPSPNGVPDYIDEVAWAFDSAWSMEIDRFGFVQPLPYTSSSHASNRYKVMVIDMDVHHGSDQGRFYGLTTPLSESSGASIGIPSYIELRNQWKGWTDPDYELHPEQAVRVTAVHEFFHTIQFAMTRNVNNVDSNYLDDFPLSWLEATAVLMEEMGFDDINDYLQYATDYFDNPTLDVFSGYGDYTISLLLMYVTQHISTPGDISFTKSMFFNNYRSYINFRDNLLISAKGLGKTWADLLGNFHAESFFTNDRSTVRPFIADASLLPAWSYGIDSLDNSYSLQKKVSTYAMETFSFKPKQAHGNSLRITFIGDSIPGTDTNPLWSVHGILRRSDERDDSVFSLPVFSSGALESFVANWSSFSEALMIVTNAHSESSHSASLVFETCPVALRAGDSTIYQGVIPAPLSAVSSMYVSVKALADLSCSLSIASVTAALPLREQAINQKLASIPVLYGISFPKTWSSSAAMTMTITEDTSSSPFISLKNNYGISSSAFAIFLWNPLRGKWDKTGNAQSAGNTYHWHFALNTPGLYGLFAQTSGAMDAESAGTIIAYPNPVRQRSEMRFRSEGKALMQLFVYSMNGVLVYKWETEKAVDTMTWSIRNTSGKPVVPGMYYALIGYKDAPTKGLKRKRQKVLIVP